MKWGRMNVFSHFYINFFTLPYLQNPPNLISPEKSVTRATLVDNQTVMVTDSRFPATLLPP